ncbi:MAG: TonB-dependent receptor [Piscinibacter sp.]|uniref:TonB-dependent receptor plug domain-containing protein n=1 Tax=Piscinibacter sp. TaxID=1903157 RepID=UPI001B46E0A1|nr:TonB-dependent receptor [Piscinibacter sp.]MBP5990929.1 TonB-dependent receptor [Piscinibacter sp.]MBP6028433.1 TonB-dependent receptor [Piscinibacter sp.]
MRPALLALAALALAPAAHAQPAAPAAAASAPASTSLERVEVQGRRDDPTEMRRNASAAKIVIGRQEIEQYGDSTLGDVIRRLPGVTQGGRPGRGGDLRMRGMGSGYTQILIDGERPPPGFSIDQISPDMVERIELLRAPTAETGTRAIAGTINIILREPLRRRNTELRPALSLERGRLSPQLSLSRDGLFGEDGSFNVSVNASENHDRTDTATRTTFVDTGSGAVTLDQLDEDLASSVRRRINASSRFQWRLGPGEQFTLQPFLMHGQSRGESEGTLAAIGAAPAAPYATRAGASSSSYDIARLNLQLTRRIGPDTRIELRGGAGHFSADAGSTLNQFAADASPVLDVRNETSIRDRSWSLAGKLLHSLGSGHNLVGGWEMEGAQRREDDATWLDGALQEGATGIDMSARTRRRALYLQDEWDPARDWSAYAGLRVETIRSTSDSGDTPVDNRSSVISPLAHLVWRFDAPRRDQLRLSLTQSYRAPTLRNLIALPALNTLYPVPGGNVASSPDRAGNPELKPEQSHGIDLALERYLANGGIVSVNLFHRRIRDLIRNVTALEDVPWAGEPRWVSRPRNLGRATVEGVEFDAKFRLTELQPDWLPLDLRMNLSLYRSRVESVPGPDNRIDQQPHAVGNLGADYRFRGTPWTVGGSLGLTPGYRTQLTEFQSQELGLRRVLDAYVLWQIDAGTRLRLSLANLVPIDSVGTVSVLQGSQLQTVNTVGRTDLNATLRLEMKL